MEYDFACLSCVVESWPINSGQTSMHFFAASRSTRCLNICANMNKLVYKIPQHFWTLANGTEVILASLTYREVY